MIFDPVINARPAVASFLVATLVFGSICAVADAAGKGEIGGPPTVGLGAPDEGTQISPALVIGAGSILSRRTEVVAYGWKAEPASSAAEFCVWAMRPLQLPEFGTCGSALGQRAIAVDMQIQAIAPKRARATSIGGRIAPEVAAVRLYFHRKKSSRQDHAVALVAQVNGGLQQRLKQPAPFGFFYAKVRGLVPFGAFKIQALDASGNVVETAGR